MGKRIYAVKEVRKLLHYEASPASPISMGGTSLDPTATHDLAGAVHTGYSAIDLHWALVAGGRISPTPGNPPVGEVVVQVKNTTGAPTHAASLGTPCWVSPDYALYVNNDASTGWTRISATGLALDDLSDVAIASPADDEILTYNGSGWVNAAPAAPAAQPMALSFVIDGGGSTITAGVKGDVELPFAGSLTAWRLFSDQDGSLVVDIWRDSYTNFPPTDSDSMPGSGKEPTLSGSKAQDTTITDWASHTFSAGDIMRFNVDSATSIQRATLSLSMLRN